MKKNRFEALKRRHFRVRKHLAGTTERPRLCVHKSLRHLYVQIIDDSVGRTLLAATTNTVALKGGELKSLCNKATAKTLGETVGRQAIEKGISQVVFDRGGYLYHGVVKELAEAVRAQGVKF